MPKIGTVVLSLLGTALLGVACGSILNKDKKTESPAAATSGIIPAGWDGKSDWTGGKWESTSQ